VLLISQGHPQKEFFRLMFRKLLPSCLALLFGLGAVAKAQEAQPPKPTEPSATDQATGQTTGQTTNQAGRRQRRPRGFFPHQKREGRAVASAQQLNLTDDQRRQGQQIRQKYFGATKSQREQLFQLREKRLAGTFTDADKERSRALRQEMMTAMRGMREESLGVLTPEQRSQLDTMREQRKQRRDGMRMRRGERRFDSPPLN